MRRREFADFTIIELDSPTCDCWVCGVETYLDFGLPVYEDLILPNSWNGEWFGATVCPRCYRLFNGTPKPIQHIAANRIAIGDFA